MVENDSRNVLRSEKLNRLISNRPPFIIEWGTVILLLFFAMLFLGLSLYTDIL